MNLSDSFYDYYNDLNSLFNNIDFECLSIYKDNSIGVIFDYNNQRYIGQFCFEKYEENE